ncbi:MAG: hypothetical protein WC777_04085 [Candidatus Gracilibacteria bacterium]|jgi:hypothetical protein
MDYTLKFAEPSEPPYEDWLKREVTPEELLRLRAWLFSGDKFKAQKLTSDRRAPSSVDSFDLIRGNADKAIRFIDKARLLSGPTGLDWKNAPVLWEILSFRDDLISGAESPLAQALAEAVAAAAEDILPVQFRPALLEDLDAVVHQTYLRRRAILDAIQTWDGADLSGQSPLAVASILRQFDAAPTPDYLCDQISRRLSTSFEG